MGEFIHLKGVRGDTDYIWRVEVLARDAHGNEVMVRRNGRTYDVDSGGSLRTASDDGRGRVVLAYTYDVDVSGEAAQ